MNFNFENLDEESIKLLKDILREKFEEIVRNPLIVQLLRDRPDLVTKYEPLFQDVLEEKMIEDLAAFLKALP